METARGSREEKRKEMQSRNDVGWLARLPSLSGAASFHIHLASVRAEEPKEAFEQTPEGPGMFQRK